MKNLIELTKWNEFNAADTAEATLTRKFSIHPQFIMAIDELPASRVNNISQRTRIDYRSGTGFSCVLVQETMDDIKKMVLELSAENIMSKIILPTHDAQENQYSSEESLDE